MFPEVFGEEVPSMAVALVITAVRFYWIDKSTS